MCSDGNSTGHSNPVSPTTVTAPENVDLKIKDPEDRQPGITNGDAISLELGDNLQEKSRGLSRKHKMLVILSAVVQIAVLLGVIALVVYLFAFSEKNRNQIQDIVVTQGSNTTNKGRMGVQSSHSSGDNAIATETYQPTDKLSLVQAISDVDKGSSAPDVATVNRSPETTSQPPPSTDWTSDDAKFTTTQPPVTTTKKGLNKQDFLRVPRG